MSEKLISSCSSVIWVSMEPKYKISLSQILAKPNRILPKMVIPAKAEV
jgi:hypothetical protein